MRYSTEIFRYSTKTYSFAKRFGGKYDKKLMDATTKAGIDGASKMVVQKTVEATGDLIRNKIANKITSAGKSKEDEKTKKYCEKKDNK